MGQDWGLLDAAVAGTAVRPEEEPVPGGKVDSLPDGEAVREASMVCPREGHHELSRFLHSPAHFDICTMTPHGLDPWQEATHCYWVQSVVQGLGQESFIPI